MPEGEENPPYPFSPFIVPSVEAGLLPKKKIKKNKKKQQQTKQNKNKNQENLH